VLAKFIKMKSRCCKTDSAIENDDSKSEKVEIKTLLNGAELNIKDRKNNLSVRRETSWIMFGVKSKGGIYYV